MAIDWSKLLPLPASDGFLKDVQDAIDGEALDLLKAVDMAMARDGLAVPPQGSNARSMTLTQIENGLRGDVALHAIHKLAKRVDEMHKAAAADAESLNQTVETFAKALAEIQENGFRYRGFWRQGTHATRGEAYTENGGLWYCLRATTDRPRNESPDWNMCARAGRDGRDAR